MRFARQGIAMYVKFSLQCVGLVSRKSLVRSALALPLSSSKLVVHGHRLVTFAHTINETLKCLTQLPALMQSHSGSDRVASRW